MPSPAAPKSTSRSEMNHARLLDAAVEALAHDGWASCLPSPVGIRAGLSRQPALHRFPDRASLAVAVWNERLAAPFTAVLDELVDAFFGLATQPQRLAAAFQTMLTPDPELRAAAELVVAAQFNPELRTAVDASVGRSVGSLLDCPAPASAAARALVVAQALGLVMLGSRAVAPTLDAAVIARRFAEALRDLGPVIDVPAASAAHMYDDPIAFATGDPIRDRLLNAALEQVGTHGFDGVNVKSIAKAAGYTEGALWNRWPSKMALFHEATQRQTDVGLAANEEWIAAIARDHGVAAAEAVAMREQMAPGRERVRAVYLEQARLTWRDPALADTVEATLAAFLPGSRLADDIPDDTARATLVHAAWAMSYGVVLLAVIAPDSWRLPFVCVTSALGELDG